MSLTWAELLESVSEQIVDYREGDIPRRTPNHIEKWVSQFPEENQYEILAEVNNFLSKTYITYNDMAEFLRNLITNEKFCGRDPIAFWKRANLLNIQQGGNSQREILIMFEEILRQEIGLELIDCGSQDGPFIYLDDGVFGGGRVFQDISKWVRNDAPERCDIHIVVAALHMNGQYYANKRLDEIEKETNKKIKRSWWRIIQIENRKRYKNESDVLWPTVVPDGPLAQAYVRYITEEEPRWRLELRKPGSVGELGVFSSDEARILLEQEFLKAGLYIRSQAPLLPESARPLGVTLMKCFGFGSTIITFRNCPNNCPLAFWAGDPWYPLFPRSTNTDAFRQRLIQSLNKKFRKG